MNFFKSPLSRKILYYVILCSSFFTLLGTCVQLYFSYKDEVKSVFENINLVKTSYMGAISSSLYELDSEQLEVLLNGVLTLRDIRYLEVRDNVGDGSLMARAGDASDAGDHVEMVSIYFKNSGQQSLHLGNLKIVATYDNAETKVINSLATILITNGIKTFLASFVIYLLLNHLVTRHLHSLSGSASDMKEGSFSKPFVLDRKTKQHDELDALVGALNTAHQDNVRYLRKIESHKNELEGLVDERTKELRMTHQKMLKMAHQAGMSEVATGTLHNLGNALNSLGVKIELLLSADDKFSQIYDKIAGLIGAEVKREGFMEERLEKIGKINDVLEETNHKLSDSDEGKDISALKIKETLKYLHKVIYSQQQAAKTGDYVNDVINMQELVGLVLGLVSAAKSQDFVINENISISEPFVASKSKLTQILVNLVENAYNAYEGKENPEKVIDIEAKTANDNVVITVADKGVGIKKEAFTRVFEFGYTTRENGNGFGLHNSANLANELGGHLTFKSELGVGTTFKLEIPHNANSS